MHSASLSRLLIIVVFLLATACTTSEQLGETETSEINKILKTGVAQPGDPYVRAETMRVVELLADPALATYAQEGLDDKSPMVRLAALRATLATNPSEGERAASRVFSRGTPDEKRAVLRALSNHEMGPGQRELLGRALRSTDPELRRIAFEANFLKRVDEAFAAKNQKLLDSSIYPELGRYIGIGKDPVLAALAVAKFIEQGQEDRAEPLIKALKRDDLPLDQRIAAAKILMWAQAKPALEPFREIVARYDAALVDQDTLGVPTDVVPEELLRLAILGTVAAGDQTYVRRAKKYIDNVSEESGLEVLEALAPNESPEAAVSLKVAMADARRPVRFRAIELYQQRKDADPKALIAALKGADFETQKRLTRVLMERFPEAWTASLRSQLPRNSAMEPTLALLRDVITTREEAEKIAAPLRDVFQKIADEEKGKKASLASYFLAITAGGEEEATLAAGTLDDPTRYVYLEFLVRTEPQAHVETFRKYFYDDLFVIRLMSAAGLWRVLGTKA